jgi:TolB-like protein
VNEIFVSYARPDEADAVRVAEELSALGYSVWRDNALPPHRLYADVIEERLKSAKAVVVLWSADAAKSEWVRAEADVARARHTLVQAALDETMPPMPFNQVQCVSLTDWKDAAHPGWRKITESVAELVGTQGQSQMALAAVVASPPERIRIAVEFRPIVMASGRDSGGLASGLNGEIAKAVACLPGLHVVSSETAHRGQVPAYLVDGALQRAGDQLRLTVRLLSSLDGSLVWSDRYDGSLRDLFGFQERAGTNIASNVDTIVRTLEIEKSASVPESRLDIRQLYYRAIGSLRKMERQSLNDGARYAESVIRLAPDHGHALALASCIYLNIWMLGLGDGDADEARLKASDRASRALRLWDHDHWVAALSAMVLAWVGHPISVSMAQLDRIRATAPSFAPAWFWSALVHTRAGDPLKAIEHYARAIELEPLTPQRSTMTGYMGTAKVAAGDFEGALPLLIEALRVRPQWTSLYVFSAIALSHLGRSDEARRELAVSESFAPVGKSRWPTRDAAQRRLLCEGLGKAGFVNPEPIFADVP